MLAVAAAEGTGSVVGTALGTKVGAVVGLRLGVNDGARVGSRVGCFELNAAALVGESDGEKDGNAAGAFAGERVPLADDGKGVGHAAVAHRSVPAGTATAVAVQNDVSYCQPSELLHNTGRVRCPCKKAAPDC